MSGPTCPACNRPLNGLATYCWGCMEYVADLTTADPVPVKSAPAHPDDTRTEKQIQQAVKNALGAMGFACWDLSQPFAAAITPGLADLYVVGRGVCAWAEIKRHGTKQTAVQRDFEALVIANGGLYVVLRHESEAIAWAEALGLRGAS